MSEVLHKRNPVVTGVADTMRAYLLAAGATAGTYEHAIEGQPTPPYVTVRLGRGGGLEGVPLAGDQWSDVPIVVWVVGQSVPQVSLIADELSWAFAGRDTDGVFSKAMTAVGLKIVKREIDEMYQPDVIQGKPQGGFSGVVTVAPA